MSDELPRLTLAGRAYVVVPAALAAKHGLGAPDPVAERRREHGARLRAARVHAGLSQADLATTLGVTQPYLSTVEHGREYCGDERTGAWLAACGLAPDWTPPKRPPNKRTRKA